MAIRFEGALLTPSIFNREVVLVIEPQSRRVSRIVKRVAGSLFREQRLSSMALHPLKNNRGSISTAATKHACHPRGVLPFFRGEIATVSQSIFFQPRRNFVTFFEKKSWFVRTILLSMFLSIILSTLSWCSTTKVSRGSCSHVTNIITVR